MLFTRVEVTGLARGRPNITRTKCLLSLSIVPAGLHQLRKVNQFQVHFSSRNDKKKLLILIIPVTTFCLGTWQIFRLRWKIGLIEELEQKTRKPAVDIPLE